MAATVEFPNLGLEFPLSRVAFSIGSFDVYWYGIILGLGLALGMAWALKNAREFGLDQDRLIDIILVGTVAGIIGARLYYVVFAPAGEFTSFWQVFDLRRGGVAFYGAVIFGIGSAALMCRRNKTKLLPVVDVAAVGFLIGQGIGRWGNFFNQEAFGVNTDLPWGMTSDVVRRYLSANLDMLAQKGITVDPALPVHPTFLYESLWCALGFILISRYIKKRKFDGEVALMYFAWNGFGRAIIEGLRTDSLYLGSIRISQLLAALGCAASVIAILVIRDKIKKSPDKNYLVPYGHTDECARELAAIAERRADKTRAEHDKETDSVPLLERVKTAAASFAQSVKTVFTSTSEKNPSGDADSDVKTYGDDEPPQPTEPSTSSEPLSEKADAEPNADVESGVADEQDGEDAPEDNVNPETGGKSGEKRIYKAKKQ